MISDYSSITIRDLFLILSSIILCECSFGCSLQGLPRLCGLLLLVLPGNCIFSIFLCTCPDHLKLASVFASLDSSESAWWWFWTVQWCKCKCKRLADRIPAKLYHKINQNITDVADPLKIVQVFYVNKHCIGRTNTAQIYTCPIWAGKSWSWNSEWNSQV